MINLKGVWMDLLSGYTTKSRVINEFWAEIEASYTQENRHYHTLGHLEYMVGKALEYKKCLTEPDIVLFSIFYHDIVYNPYRQDNEQKSAEVAKDRLIRLGLSVEQIKKCYNQIIATKSHRESSDRDSNFLMDFDLAILGESQEQYQVYKAGIRKEYSVFPDFLFNRGRKKVLQYFLAMDRIYKTKEFYSKYELQAKRNLADELKRLE